MNHKATEKILNAIRPFCDLNDILISTENKDWRGRNYKSDYVTIIKRHNIGFEVFDNEIIAFYFTDHCHFEDYSSTTEDDADYVTRAIDFLTRLFTLPIRYVKVTRGKRVKREEYFFVMQNGQEESMSGPCIRLFGGNPFLRKITTKVNWQYDKTAGDFINYTPKHIDPDAICYVTVSDNIYFEIYERNAVFTYVIMKKDYDDYNEMFYWIAYDDGTKSMFDSKEKAIEAAKMQIKIKNIVSSNCLYNAVISDMKKVIRDDYVFNIDIEKTKSLYSNMPIIFDGLSEYLPELTHFFVSLGIDIEKPVKYDLNDTYDLLYTTFGSVSSKNGYELDFHRKDKYVSVAVVSAHENIISLEVFGITKS